MIETFCYIQMINQMLILMFWQVLRHPVLLAFISVTNCIVVRWYCIYLLNGPKYRLSLSLSIETSSNATMFSYSIYQICHIGFITGTFLETFSPFFMEHCPDSIILFTLSYFPTKTNTNKTKQTTQQTSSWAWLFYFLVIHTPSFPAH